jgi:hypothetical protein
MAEQSGSPAFKPPMNHTTESDPQIVRVPMDRVDFGFRPSQRPPMTNEFGISHIPNGGRK